MMNWILIDASAPLLVSMPGIKVIEVNIRVIEQGAAMAI
jgi:hypothetical protein